MSSPTRGGMGMRCVESRGGVMAGIKGWSQWAESIGGVKVWSQV